MHTPWDLRFPWSNLKAHAYRSEVVRMIRVIIEPIGEFLQSFILISLDWRIIWIKIGWCAYIMNEKDRSFAANTSSNQIVHLTMEFAIEPLAIHSRWLKKTTPCDRYYLFEWETILTLLFFIFTHFFSYTSLRIINLMINFLSSIQ